MTIRRPTQDQLAEIAKDFGFSMTHAEMTAYAEAALPGVQLYEAIDAMSDNLSLVKYPRTPGYRPQGSENEYNAWHVKVQVDGNAEGKLAGKRIALKDSISLAGVPMINGSTILDGYVPEIDATIVTRILDAGGTIAGKAHCEYFCLSGGSHTGAKGPVHNPRRFGHSAGGSSSGSAALVAAGEVEMAVGCDQAGSIRIPSSYCGIYGLKPTFGLVPYTGIMSIDPSFDHAGPMTATVEDNALLLEVLAGADGIDPRQKPVPTVAYTDSLGRSIDEMRIAVVKEGFGHPNSEPDVDDKVREGAALLASLGATVEEVSIPLHLHGPAIWGPIGFEGALSTILKGNGFGTGLQGLYVPSMVDAVSVWRERANELPATVKIEMLVGEYFARHYRGRYYGKAQNQVRRLRAAYDEVLARYDLLLMPTMPMKAPPLPPSDAPLSLYLQRSFEFLVNTPSFDVTYHPAMTLPCGWSDGLPIGMMLIARHFDESSIYRAAHAFERASTERDE
jgi:amidase